MSTAKTKKLNVRDSIVARHAEMAATAFSKHVLTERLNQGMFRSWRCAQPDRWAHGFDITTTPGNLFITGDIGDLIVSRTEDMIAWARGSIHSIGYFAEKVPHDIPTKVWSSDRAKEWIKEEIRSLKEERRDPRDEARITKLYQELREELHDEADEHTFSKALYESRLVDDWPDLRVWNSNFLWCREAVKWLLDHLPPPTELDE